jgi:hypothetical protein
MRWQMKRQNEEAYQCVAARTAVQSGGSDNLSATFAADRAFTAAVAGRSATVATATINNITIKNWKKIPWQSALTATSLSL